MAPARLAPCSSHKNPKKKYKPGFTKDAPSLGDGEIPLHHDGEVEM